MSFAQRIICPKLMDEPVFHFVSLYALSLCGGFLYFGVKVEEGCVSTVLCYILWPFHKFK